MSEKEMKRLGDAILLASCVESLRGSVDFSTWDSLTMERTTNFAVQMFHQLKKKARLDESEKDPAE